MMKSKRDKAGRADIFHVLAALLLAALAVGVLLDSQTVADGVRAGLNACGNVLIPSLFPFMALCCFLSLTDYARILSVPLTPLTTRVFKLPRELGVIVLLSLIGGYPVGAKMIANLLDQGRIDKSTAERMLCFCVNASPSFLISAVGVGMLRSRGAGVALYAAQVLATVIIGAAVSLRAKRPDNVQTPPAQAGGVAAFVAAVSDASAAMIGMCAYAMLFSALLALVSGGGIVAAAAGALSADEGVVRALVSGLFEVTTGSLQSAKLGGEGGIVLLSLCASFGGLSVIFQAISFFKSKTVRFLPFFAARCAHCVLAALLVLPLYRLLGEHVSVWLPSPQPAAHSDLRSAVLTVCLLCMCSMLVMSAGKSRHR